MPYKNNFTRKEYLIRRPCVVCKIIKPKSEFNKFKHTCKECEEKELFNCYSCKEIKHKSLFPKDNSQRIGISHKCKKCKNKQLSIKRKNKTT